MPPEPAPTPRRLRAVIGGTGHPHLRTNVKRTGQHRLRAIIGGTGHPNLSANVVVVVVVGAAGAWR